MLRAGPPLCVILCSACVDLTGLVGGVASNESDPPRRVAVTRMEEPDAHARGPSGAPSSSDAAAEPSTPDGPPYASAPLDASDASARAHTWIDASVSFPPEDAGSSGPDGAVAQCFGGFAAESEPNDFVPNFLPGPGLCGTIATASDVDRFSFRDVGTVIQFVAQADATITVTAGGESVTRPSPVVIYAVFADEVDYEVVIRSPSGTPQAYRVQR